MEKIIQLLKEREKDLLKIKKGKEKALEKAPEGCLRICKHGRSYQYYHRKIPADFSGVYIKAKDKKLAQRLAQKDYDEKVLRSADKEINAIRRFLATIPDISIEDIYESIHKERQLLVQPIVQTEEEYVISWESVEYQGKGFDANTPQLFTAKGERVRSKSEVIIADSLNREGIPYRYECPIYVEGWGSVHPDFTILNIKERKEIYWEHLGLMDDMDYVGRALEKITVYGQNGILPGKNLILTYETAKYPLNQKMVHMMIEEYLR